MATFDFIKDDGVRNEPKQDDYIQWKVLPPGGPLNRWSQNLTRDHDFPGAQVREYSPSVSARLLTHQNRLCSMLLVSLIGRR